MQLNPSTNWVQCWHEQRKRVWLLLGVSTLVILLDQWTKYLIYSKFQWGESVSVFPGLFSITYVRNMGAAFGFLHNAPAWFRDPFFIIIPILALGIILLLFFSAPKDAFWAPLALSMVFGGAIGNLIDRLRFGYVVDFLDFYIKTSHWPAFNVADSCIVVGVSILFIHSFFSGSSVAKKTT